MAPAIIMRGVGKRFALGDIGKPSARQILDDRFKAPFRSAAADTKAGEFWALRDIDLDIAQGEIVGVVGRNGAGKSVLFKMLARVTRPSCGTIRLRGQVAPLLEVGTGFHPDLTGRENTFLNGVILGMRRQDVARRMDAIVDFAGIDAFIDWPIRRYSTGMRMRLAFAVAAHLDRDIFLLDEVFAVGDVAFQEKCLARVRALAAEGRTIMLVSHGDYEAARLCDRAILLDHGRLIATGMPDEVLERYEALISREETVP